VLLALSLLPQTFKSFQRIYFVACRFIQPLVHDAGSPQAAAGAHPGAVLTLDDLDDEVCVHVLWT
jgi:hypothetical protein